MGCGMSFMMTLLITYINTGFDKDYFKRFITAWSVSFPVAMIATSIVAPIVKKIVDKGYERARKVLTEKIDDLHKLAKALLIYETLSGDEIRDLILKNIKPTRSFKDEDEDDGKTSSALGSLGLKPKPAI